MDQIRYVLIDVNNKPVVWNNAGVPLEFRIFEDPKIANKHMQLAEKLAQQMQLNTPITIKQMNNIQDINNFIICNFNGQQIWVHYFALPEGYSNNG